MSELLELERGKRWVVHVLRASLLERPCLLYGTISNACAIPFEDRRVHGLHGLGLNRRIHDHCGEVPHRRSCRWIRRDVQHWLQEHRE